MGHDVNHTPIRWTDLRRSLCALAFSALAAGCSVNESGKIHCNDTTNCPDAYPTCSAAGLCVASAAAAKVVVVSGDAQTAVVATALQNPLVAEVLDANNNPVANFSIAWAVVSGGGSVSAATTTTGPDGKASVTATLGTTDGANSFSATGAGLTPGTVTFNASGTSGVAATLSTVSGNGQTATVHTALAAPFTVLVEDANHNPVAGQPVTFAVVSGGGSLAAATATTGADGKASTTATLGSTVGSNTFTASSTNGTTALSGSPQTFTATGTPAIAASFVVTFPTSVVANSVHSATVSALDAFGNSTSYSGTVNVSIGPPADPGATVPQGVALTIAAGGTASVPGVVFHQATAGQSVTITDTTTSSIKGTQSGITVASAASATALVSGANPSIFGSSVTFTATVTSSGGTPTGTVTFKDGTTTIGTGALNGSGVATFSTAALLGGTHSISAVFGGDVAFATSTSNIVSQLVNTVASASAISRTAGASPAIYGDSLTFAVAVTSAAGIPTGTVNFKDGSTVIGTSAVNASGIATFTTSALTAVSHAITGVYSGDSNFSTSTSSVLTQVVTKAVTSTAVMLTSGTNPSTFGQSLTFTATVTSTPTGATGSVTFKDNGVTLGSNTLSAGETTTFSTSALLGGSHTITAVYLGDLNFQSSTSPGLVETISSASSSTALASSLNPSTFSQSVTFTATVTSTTPGTPTGTVTFMDGATTLGTGNLNGSSIATFATGALTGGVHSITAVYGGDANYGASTSTALSQTVNKVTTSVTVSAVPMTSSAFGQSVAFTATIALTGVGAGTPTGSVKFQDTGVDIGTCTAQAVSGGTTASCVLTNLAVGAHSIVGIYSGDGNFVTSTSTALPYTVNKATTSVTVVPSPVSPSAFGQSVTFTATIAITGSGAGTPSGTVKFQDNTVDIGGCTAQAVSGGTTATCTLTNLVVGAHSIVGVYSGDGNFATSTSSAVPYTVSKATTTTTVAPSPASPSAFGQSVTFTATIAITGSGAGTPSGTVKFQDNTVDIGGCTAQAVSLGTTATCTLTNLTVGAHSIVGIYSGDSSFATSTSVALPYTVSKATTTTSVAPSPASPSASGQSVTFTATIAITGSGAGTPTGTVKFQDNTVDISGCTARPVAGGTTATCVLTNLAVGSHSIVGIYSGDGSFATSTSTAVPYTVNKATTSVTVTALPTVSSVAGQSVTFTATVGITGSGAGTPTGSVKFQDNTVDIGTCTAQAVSGGTTATCTLTNLAVGSHSLVGIYSGDANFATSTSAALSYTVNLATTTTTVAPSPASPSVAGQSVTFTATIAITGNGAGTPTGSVKFQDNTVDIGGCTAQAVSGGTTATCTLTNLAVGSHSIVGIYGGDGNFATSTSSAVPYTVNKASTTTTVAPSPASPSVSGQSVTFTATIAITGSGAGTPTGTVRFQDNTVDISGCTVQTVSSGTTATCILTNLAVGSHSIVGIYSGDGNFATSTSSAVPYTVNKASTTTTVAPSPVSPSAFGQSVTFTATIAITGSGAGTPTGTVKFQDNTVDIGGCTAQAVSGGTTATCTLTSLAVGSHSVVGIYSSDANFAASTSVALPYTVNLATTTTGIISDNNPSTSGQDITFTATVSPQFTGTPSGSVQLFDGATSLSTLTLTGGSVGFLAVGGLAVGSHNMTIQYAGDSHFSGSTSSILIQVVKSATTTTLVDDAVGSVPAGTPVKFTATVTSGDAGTRTGTVNFTEGASVLGTGSVAVDGTATFTTAALAAGSHAVVAVYLGDANFAGSTSATDHQTITTLPSDPTSTATVVLGGAGVAGKILIAGGRDEKSGALKASTFLFDPATSTMSPGPSLKAARAFHTATAIGNGQVLIAGGSNAAGTSTFEVCTLGGAQASCAVTGGGASLSRCNAAAALVTSTPARVLVAGGDDCAGGAASTTWDLWDGSSAGSMANPLSSSADNALSEGRKLLTATVVADGLVLLAGGGNASADLFTYGQSTTVQQIGPMLAARSGHSATLLTAGSSACSSGSCVLLAGGASAQGSASWEIFDAVKLTFARPAGSAEMVAGTRSAQAAALLADGRVLLAGGSADGKPLATTELFDPSTLSFSAGLSLRSASLAPAAAFAPAQNSLVIFGGAGAAVESISAP